MVSLYDKYFGESDAEPDVEQADEQLDGAAILFGEWFDHPVTKSFLGVLDMDLERSEVGPGTSDEIVYAAGVRRGLLIVKRRLMDAEQIKRNLNEQA